MKRAQFRVTFETVTEESAAEGCNDSHGFVNRFGDCVALESVDLDAIEWDGRPAFQMTLREALDIVARCNAPWIEGREPSDSSGRARWVTVYGGRDYETGAAESRSIHFPDKMTAATNARLVRIATGARRGE